MSVILWVNRDVAFVSWKLGLTSVGIGFYGFWLTVCLWLTCFALETFIFFHQLWMMMVWLIKQPFLQHLVHYFLLFVLIYRLGI